MKQFLEILNEKAKEAGVRIRLMSYEPDLIELAAKEYESQFRQAAVMQSPPLDGLPENKPLYKDSGLWQMRSDDMEDVIIQQGVNESDDDFLKRCREVHTEEMRRLLSDEGGGKQPVAPALPSVEQIKKTLYECAKIENTGDGVKMERLFEKEAEALLKLFGGNAG